MFQCFILFQSVLQLHSLKSGELIRNFSLDVGTVSGFSGEKKYSEIFYHFTSILNPGIIYTMDLKKDENPKVLFYFSGIFFNIKF